MSRRIGRCCKWLQSTDARSCGRTWWGNTPWLPRLCPPVTAPPTSLRLLLPRCGSDAVASGSSQRTHAPAAGRGGAIHRGCHDCVRQLRHHQRHSDYYCRDVDRTLLQVAPVNGRTLLRPDVVGQYTVVATIVSASYGTTNVTQTITAAMYMGINTCALCHSGGVIAEDKFQTWQTTAHSMIFSNGIDGYLGSYSASCLACHTVGYDTTPSAAADNGFYSVQQQTKWVFPTVLSPTNFATMTNVLRNLGNIQCENCHGPGSQHAYGLGDTNLITKTVKSGDCNQCHDAPTHHVKGTEWYVSRHALTTGPGSANCLPCHSANGFIARADANTNGSYAVTPVTNVTFAPISCQACHEPHGDTVPANNPHLLRTLSAVTMPDGTVVTNAGEGALCLECHQNRNGSATNQLVNYPLGKTTWFGGSSFGAHDNPQGDMIEGINAHTYGQSIPSSAHRYSVTNLCVGCHMQTVNVGDPAF